LAVRAPNGRKPLNRRVVLDGILWIARTGSPWCDLPEEFGKWSSVYRQFRRWTLAGLWEDIMEALNESGLVPDTGNSRHAVTGPGSLDSGAEAHGQQAGCRPADRSQEIDAGFSGMHRDISGI
jgi:transposase